jgi:hypothetical protein
MNLKRNTNARGRKKISMLVLIFLLAMIGGVSAQEDTNCPSGMVSYWKSGEGTVYGATWTPGQKEDGTSAWFKSADVNKKIGHEYLRIYSLFFCY